ncbi:unnamed protein product, partial [Prorocentrum cordatum]
VMTRLATTWEEVGVVSPERIEADASTEVVGYQFLADPPTPSVDLTRGALLQDSRGWLLEVAWVDIEQLKGAVPPMGVMQVNGVWAPAAATRAASPAPSLASAGSSGDKVSPAPSAHAPLFLTPPGSAGALTPPNGGADPRVLELAKRLLDQQAPPAAVARSTAEVRGSVARLWGTSRSRARYWCGRRGGLLAQWTLFLGLCMAAPAWLAPSRARSVGAVAHLSEDLADATGAIAQVAKNDTLLVSDVAVSLTNGPVPLVQEAWSGVDLADSLANASGAHFLVLRGVTRKHGDLLWNAIAGVGQLFPHLTVSEHRFRTASYFDFFEYEVRLFRSGYVGVRFLWARMSFGAVWAKPHWEFVGADVTPELEAIGGLTRESISADLDLGWLREPFSDAEDELQVSPPAWIRLVQLLRQQ